jgi:hypothetical protein
MQMITAMKHDEQTATMINLPCVGDGIDTVVPALINAAIDADIELKRMLNQLSRQMVKIDCIHRELMHVMDEKPEHDQIMTKLECDIATHVIHTHGGIPYLIRFQMNKELEPRWWLVISEIIR